MGHAGAAFGIYSTKGGQAGAGGQKGCNALAEEGFVGKIINPLC